MRVRFEIPTPGDHDQEEAPYVAGQHHLSESREYEVHALSVYDRVVFLLVVDDLDTPIFLPRSLFRTVSHNMPADWIGTVFTQGPVQLVVGPEFIARDLDSYNAMVDQNMLQVEAFWRRSDGRSK